MSRFIDLTGQRFGNLVVVGVASKFDLPPTKSKSKVFECLCDCGKRVFARSSLLKNGDKKSCGCIDHSIWSETAKRVHSTHNLSKTKLYHIWVGIKDRCYNKNNKDFKHYGAKGVCVSDIWRNDFVCFYKWAYNNNYCDGLSIDRIDNNGNYEPSNCRWITIKEQQNNKSSNIIYEYNGEKLTQSQLCRKYNINLRTFRYRFNKGMSIDKCLNTPIRKTREVML